MQFAYRIDNRIDILHMKFLFPSFFFLFKFELPMLPESFRAIDKRDTREYVN